MLLDVKIAKTEETSLAVEPKNINYSLSFSFENLSPDYK